MNDRKVRRKAPAYAVALTVGVLTLPACAWAVCDSPEDFAAVANTRAAIDANCDCANAISRSAYLRCAKNVANEEIVALRLERTCRKTVLKCAKRSTCGKPVGVWPCCKTNRYGRTSCKIRLPEQCRSGPGGSHCVGIGVRSCCDACLGLGQCAPPETTSTTTTTIQETTTTTTVQDTTTTSTTTLP
jgi:hypothetical protein